VTLQVEAHNVAHDPIVDLDDPGRRGALALQPRPPSLEVRSIIGLRRSERGHPYSDAIPRVLEQHAEITIFDLAKDFRSAQPIRSASSTMIPSGPRT
jgi:hypothetical protein